MSHKTTEQLLEKATSEVAALPESEKARLRERLKKPRKLPREYGPADFLDRIRGLTEAARKIQREEQLLLKFDPQGKPVN